MANIQLYNASGSGLTTRDARGLAGALSGVNASTSLALARIDSAVQRREAVADGVTAMTARALQQVAQVSQAEVALAQLVPHASGRLAAVADAHALAITAVVVDTARCLSRLV